MTDKPIIASHSNVRALCNHPRNLKKEQIQELIRRKGLIGMNYYRNFVGGTEDIEAIIKTYGAVLNLGGEDVLVLGGDFDGCSGKFLRWYTRGAVDACFEKGNVGTWIWRETDRESIL